MAIRQEKIFVVRLWTDDANQSSWRASAEDLLSKQNKSFATLNKLAAFLKEQASSETELSD